MAQGTLFDTEPDPIGHHGYAMTRQSDPTTSMAAAFKHEVTGKAESNRRIILGELERHDGQTGHELGASTGLGQVECCRRLSELLKDGLVTRCESDRPCTVRPESKQMRWWYAGE